MFKESQEVIFLFWLAPNFFYLFSQLTLVGYSWSNQGIFLYLIFPEHSEYFPELYREFFPNILGTSHRDVP